MEELLKEVTDETGGWNQVERQKDKWQHPQTLPKLQVATSYILGHDSPRKWNVSRWLIK